jgi:hypothetical protein
VAACPTRINGVSPINPAKKVTFVEIRVNSWLKQQCESVSEILFKPHFQPKIAAFQKIFTFSKKMAKKLSTFSP